MNDPALTDPLLTPWLRRMRFAMARPYLDRGSVLDLGFGSGLLASLVPPERYYGFDIARDAVSRARTAYPTHTFSNALPEGRRFDRVISLAVIEHTPEPAEFLCTCARFLSDDGMIFITTPNPALEWVHGAFASVGLLSHEAHEEHQSILGRAALTAAADSADLVIDKFRYFMFGANQAVTLRRKRVGE